MSRCSLPASMLSGARMSVTKCASVARVSSSRKTSFSPSSCRAAPRVFGHEHGRGGPRVADQPLDHLPDFVAALASEKSDAALDALGGERHQALLEDIAGMLDVGREGEDFRQAAVLGVVESVDVERGQVFLDRPVEPVEHIVHALGFA